MSDMANGPGWWQASDGKWYAPELHPDRAQLPPPPAPSPPVSPSAGYEPPPVPGGYGWAEPAPPRSSPPPPGPVPPYPDPAGPPPSSSRSGCRTAAIVLGAVGLLMIAGCAALVFAFRSEIGEALIDFSDAEVVSEPASCAITGVDFADDYKVEATLEAANADVRSHYELIYVISANGVPLGSDWTVFRDMEPGEIRTEGVFNTIDASRPIDAVECRVEQIRRRSAG